MSNNCSTDDRVENVLSAQQRRVFRALLNDVARPADPILREEETLNSEEYLTVCYEFHHVLLPALADERFVEFDRTEDEVRRGPRFDEMDRFLAQIDHSHDA